MTITALYFGGKILGDHRLMLQASSAARFFQRIFPVLTFLASQITLAGWHFSLTGSLSDNNLGYSTQNSRNASASIATDLGNYLRIGLTHRQNINLAEGLEIDENTREYAYSREESRLIANSLDLTVILYYGDILVPYIQLGAVKKSYLISSTDESGETKIRRATLSPVPNGGVGVGIRLNKNFSLKVSYTVSPGIRQTLDKEEPESVLDSYTSVGITYSV